MNKLTKIVLPLILLIFLTDPLLGQVNLEKVAQTGLKFLSVSVGAHGAGMGDAFSAVANNAEAMFWNPAGMAYINKWNISGGYNQWIAGIKHQYTGLAYNTGNIGVLGVNLIWVDYGTAYGTRRSEADPRGYIETGPFSPSALSAGFTYSRQVSDRFSFGVNVKYVHQDLGTSYIGTGETTEEFKEETKEINAFAFDFGTLYYIGFKDLRIAMCAKNVSAEYQYETEAFSLPLTLRIGIAMDLLKAFSINTKSSLILAIDAIHPRDYQERVHFGMEYSFYNMIALRAGYKFNYDEDNLSFGVGLKEKRTGIKVDYAYNPFGDFDAVHRISVGVGF